MVEWRWWNRHRAADEILVPWLTLADRLNMSDSSSLSSLSHDSPPRHDSLEIDPDLGSNNGAQSQADANPAPQGEIPSSSPTVRVSTIICRRFE